MFLRLVGGGGYCAADRTQPFEDQGRIASDHWTESEQPGDEGQPEVATCPDRIEVAEGLPVR